MWVEEVSITADDTWEHKSFAIDALAQAASAIDTTQGYRIQFMMLAGSNYTDGSTGWNSGGSGKPATTNQDNLADATGNILGITNVQWEVGSVATDFAHEDIGTSLAKAQRYFWRVVSGTNNAISAVASYSSTTNWYGPLYFPVTMRAAATLSVSDVAHFGIFNNGAQTVTSAISLSGRDDGLAITEWELTTAGRTAGHAGSFHSLHASATMDLSAEL